ncbi:hypothetical protein GCM10027280_35110 [Micromonospora polyrhachis]|uniref:DNA polymerase III subunit gamma/tau n=1 Tax=Micromonospora polyrhachis TaxID=1282883 RepID=A0A7W7SR37_9ACTN|nr:DNA polymerase III subunit gamma and tau [Micromonospora polyrhachis]MBB4959413.1 DNA polymerase-3 subunit gamma/tau [Micromonospora polyrhachis]
MALALYRKYRPRTFAEIIGQEHVTEPLSQALRSGRLNHAYLFSGPRGCGKTSSARILARSLNCEKGPTPEPCGVCDSCRALGGDGAGSIDVLEIDAASHGGVDDARELREKAFFAPASSRYKIYVIDEAHMVSSAGFNALLKLVEEPPEYVKFIFATTEPEKVLGTIKSRTHHYPFRLIPPSVLRPYLEQLCESEGVKVEPAVFPLVVRAGGGSARDSLSVLDQLIAGAGPEGVSYARAVALLGVTDSSLIDEMCDALAVGDGAAAYRTVDRVAEAGHDPRRFASDLLERLRDLIVLQQVPDAPTKGLVDGPADQIERMASQAERLGPATLSRCADIVHNGLVEMRGTTAPRLLLELICARMLLPGVDDSAGGLLQRLERMERRLTVPGADLTLAAPVAAPVPAAAPVEAPAPVRPTPPASPAAASPAPVATGPAPATASAPGPVASEPPSVQRVVPPEAVLPDPVTPEPPRPGAVASTELDAVTIRRSWGEVVGAVNRTNRRIAALMRDAVVRDLDGDTLVLTVKSQVLATMLSREAAVLTAALYEEWGRQWQIRCEVTGDHRGGASPAAPRPATPSPPAPARNDVRPAPGRAPAGPAGDTEWPEPVRPGGGTGPAASGSTASANGGSANGGSANGGSANGGSANGGPTATAGTANGGTANGGAPVGRGLAAARAAAAGRGQRSTATAAPTAGPKVADQDWAGEPPYDPEYDGPAKKGAAPGGSAATATVAYDGFDPGDEPLDEIVDDLVVRQTGEQQAVQVFQQVFQGVERID